MPSSTHGSQTRQKFMRMAFSKSEAPSPPQPPQSSSVTTFHFDIGLSLRTAQKQFRVSNKQLAEEFGVTEMTIGRWRKSKDASLGRIVDFAERFEMDFETFLDLPYREEA